METLPRKQKLDDEWVSLLKEAKAMGLSAEEVKSFLKSKNEEKNTV